MHSIKIKQHANFRQKFVEKTQQLPLSHLNLIKNKPSSQKARAAFSMKRRNNSTPPSPLKSLI